MNVPPLVDIGPLMSASHGSPVSPARRQVSDALNEACGTWGFFRITGHGIDPALLRNLDAQARNFFARSDEEKSQVAMAKAGSAWRGWFPVGAELTSGRPDRKEGLYIGTELPSDDPRVLAQLPLHGPNLFPDHPDGLGPAAIDWMEAVTEVGHAIMSGLAIALGLDPHWFATHLTADPTVLFRIFRYPPDRDRLTAQRPLPMPMRIRTLRRPLPGASQSTPTTGCSRCWPKTTTAVWRFEWPTVG